MIKLKNILNEHYWNERKFGEPLPKLRLEQEEPEHFGSGREITVKGYTTKHFDICASAVSLFEKLDKVENSEAEQYIKKAAEGIDHIFEMEKAVVRNEPVNHDPIKHGIELVNQASFQLGMVGGLTGDNFEEDTHFLSFHIMEMVERKDNIKIEKPEEEND